jgi:hypothetical protein
MAAAASLKWAMAAVAAARPAAAVVACARSWLAGVSCLARRNLRAATGLSGLSVQGKVEAIVPLRCPAPGGVVSLQRAGAGETSPSLIRDRPMRTADDASLPCLLRSSRLHRSGVRESSTPRLIKPRRVSTLELARATVESAMLHKCDAPRAKRFDSSLTTSGLPGNQSCTAR